MTKLTIELMVALQALVDIYENEIAHHGEVLDGDTKAYEAAKTLLEFVDSSVIDGLNDYIEEGK